MGLRPQRSDMCQHYYKTTFITYNGIFRYKRRSNPLQKLYVHKLGTLFSIDVFPNVFSKLTHRNILWKTNISMGPAHELELLCLSDLCTEPLIFLRSFAAESTMAQNMKIPHMPRAHYTDPLSYLKVSTHAKGPPHGPFEDVEVAEGPREVRVQQPERRPQCLTK